MNDDELMAMIPMHALNIDAARALRQVCGMALASARAEGRAAGLEEAAKRVEQEAATIKAVGLLRAATEGYCHSIRALATSDGAGKVEQEQWFTPNGKTR